MYGTIFQFLNKVVEQVTQFEKAEDQPKLVWGIPLFEYSPGIPVILDEEETENEEEENKEQNNEAANNKEENEEENKEENKENANTIEAEEEAQQVE